MNIEIRLDDLQDGAVFELLRLHLEEMYKHTPAESVHALQPEQLKDAAVTFWSARSNDELAGCGALKEIDTHCGEIKSMKTSQRFLRKGVAATLLTEIIAEAKRRSYTELKLETGSNAPFDAAVALYKKFGFVECDPFADYKLDPYSTYLSKQLT